MRTTTETFWTLRYISDGALRYRVMDPDQRFVFKEKGHTQARSGDCEPVKVRVTIEEIES